MFRPEKSFPKCIHALGQAHGLLEENQRIPRQLGADLGQIQGEQCSERIDAPYSEIPSAARFDCPD
jgi:hypothetical protein